MAAKRIHPIIREHFQKMGRKGGRARAKSLTPERRLAIAQKANRARQQKALDRQASGEDTASHE